MDSKFSAAGKSLLQLERYEFKRILQQAKLCGVFVVVVVLFLSKCLYPYSVVVFK